MNLDQWLKEVYDEENVSKEASGLEAMLDQMSLGDLRDLSLGRTTLEKVAAKMTQTKREALPSKSFAVPQSKAKKIGVAGEIKGEAKGKYPIPDVKHARNALARVSQFGSPAEREAVRSKVYGKFPHLKAGFEQRHGESPTSKGNIKKVEQGGIGKSAGMMRPDQPRAKDLVSGRGPEARAARMAIREKLREGCPVGEEIDKQLGIKKAASAQFEFMDKVARHLAHVHTEEAEKLAVGGRVGKFLTKHKKVGLGAVATAPIAYMAGVASGYKQGKGMEKRDEFTSPEAQAKAKVMSRALKSTKGAPPNVRKGAVKVVAKEMRKAAAALR